MINHAKDKLPETVQEMVLISDNAKNYSNKYFVVHIGILNLIQTRFKIVKIMHTETQAGCIIICIHMLITTNNR